MSVSFSVISLSICLSIHQSDCLSVLLYLCLFIWMTVCKSVISLSICLFIHQCDCLSVYPFISLFVYINIRMFIHYLLVYLSVCLSISLTVCLSFYISVCLFEWPYVNLSFACLSLCLSVHFTSKPFSFCLSTMHLSLILKCPFEDNLADFKFSNCFGYFFPKNWAILYKHLVTLVQNILLILT